jgi:hypothetical protein
MENGRKPAFQTAIGMSSFEMENMGLTKREYFAAMAMQGLCACPDLAVSRDTLAEESVKQADALLKALETKSE